MEGFLEYFHSFWSVSFSCSSLFFLLSFSSLCSIFDVSISSSIFSIASSNSEVSGGIPLALSSLAVFLLKYFSSLANLSLTALWSTLNLGSTREFKAVAILSQLCPFSLLPTLYLYGSTTKISLQRATSCFVVYTILGLGIKLK